MPFLSLLHTIHSAANPWLLTVIVFQKNPSEGKGFSHVAKCLWDDTPLSEAQGKRQTAEVRIPNPPKYKAQAPSHPEIKTLGMHQGEEQEQCCSVKLTSLGPVLIWYLTYGPKPLELSAWNINVLNNKNTELNASKIHHCVWRMCARAMAEVA